MIFKNFAFKINLPQSAQFNTRLSSTLVFLPGIMLLAMAILVFVAPALVLAIAAGLFLYLGLMLCFLGWKFIQFKRKLSELSKQLNSQIQSQAFGDGPIVVEDVRNISEKIILH